MRGVQAAFLGLLGAVSLAVSSPSAAQAPIIMKFGTATINDSQHEWMKRFAAIVDKDSAGRIKVEIYPASQLGTSPRMIEQTQLNSIQGVVGPPEFLTGVDSRYQILSAPGLFKDLAHANRTLQAPPLTRHSSIWVPIKASGASDCSFRGQPVFVTRKPVTKLADLERLKVRVLAAPLQLEQIRAMKMSPVPMPLGEVMPALQQGALDGVMSCIPDLQRGSSCYPIR